MATVTYPSVMFGRRRVDVAVRAWDAAGKPAPDGSPNEHAVIRVYAYLDGGVLAVSRYNAWGDPPTYLKGEEAERLLRTLRVHERPEE